MWSSRRSWPSLWLRTRERFSPDHKIHRPHGSCNRISEDFSKHLRHTKRDTHVSLSYRHPQIALPITLLCLYKLAPIGMPMTPGEYIDLDRSTAECHDSENRAVSVWTILGIGNWERHVSARCVYVITNLNQSHISKQTVRWSHE